MTTATRATAAPVREEPAPSTAEAARRLADWGFLANPDLPDRPGPAWLMVALRDRPTLRHFDPEAIELWVHRDGVGRRREITRATRVPLELEFSWGSIRIIDRLGVSNEYATVGGHLSAADVNGTSICVFASPAPLLRRGGHSQPADAVSFDLTAFFARMMIAVDYTPAFEGAFGSATPLGRYAAFVADFNRRYRASPALQEGQPEAWRIMRLEQARLERVAPSSWEEGRRLLLRAGQA